MKNLISIDGGETRSREWSMASPFELRTYSGEHLAITGPNGGGKSMLVDIITGKHALKIGFAARVPVRQISFRDTYGTAADKGYYLQQRWNSQEYTDDIPKVGASLEKAYSYAGEDSPPRRRWREHICSVFGLDRLWDSYLIMLSSGELRKFKLAKNLLGEPGILIVDNPFIGLDAPMRKQIVELFESLARENVMQLILVLSRDEEIPSFITHVVEVRDRVVHPKVSLDDYLSSRVPCPEHVLDENLRRKILTMGTRFPVESDEIIRMKDVTIKYELKTILNGVDWTVRKGERWAVSGPNGSGKSTLLSLVCADNPQGYACDMSLFGHRRGTGESIWDIKRHIGYVSPEMHRSYFVDIPAGKIVASGLRDHVGLHFTPSDEEVASCSEWMEIFGISSLADRSFIRLSSGEQRLVLLARAFVKNPELLILDEPLHGLDSRNRSLAQEIIETFCQNPDKTLVMVSHYADELPSCIDKTLQL